MTEFDLFGLLAVAVAVAALARRYGWPVPLVLVGVGLAASFVPFVPHYQINPHLLLDLVLPPLLYSAALSTSYTDLRRSLNSITRLGVGLVLVSAAAVALVAVWIVPHLPFAAALLLGAVVAPPDAVAAAAVGRRLGLPRRVMTLLTGESLINDATSLTLYKVALAGVATGAWSLETGVRVFAVAVLVGVGVGLAIGWAIVHDVPFQDAFTFSDRGTRSTRSCTGGASEVRHPATVATDAGESRRTSSRTWCICRLRAPSSANARGPAFRPTPSSACSSPTRPARRRRRQASRVPKQITPGSRSRPNRARRIET
jgi:hypothetical protein